MLILTLPMLKLLLSEAKIFENLNPVILVLIGNLSLSTNVPGALFCSFHSI